MAKRPLPAYYEGKESTSVLAQHIYNLLDEIKAQSDEKTYSGGPTMVMPGWCALFTDMTNDVCGYGEELRGWGGMISKEIAV